MRISDWSSDVCSSDLDGAAHDGVADAMLDAGLLDAFDEIEVWAQADQRHAAEAPGFEDGCGALLSGHWPLPAPPDGTLDGSSPARTAPRIRRRDKPRSRLCSRPGRQIGRASCRVRVCQYV